MSETLEKDKKLGQEEDEVEEEYVLLELDDCLYSDISPGAPFVFSIGEYEETVGTCYLFSESEAQPKPLSNETLPSEENTGNPTSSGKEGPSKEVNHLASVQKILKFRPVNTERPKHLAYQHKDKEI
ncbi:uncharacterized protein [Miscanthus floridulus]|uniref:uncharacterized protein isoform X3 n=1 Tax=Miscanthus floridulus TaxID=154761 RepID=UPI0034597901